jgi:glyoxylase-like metal-dependent hydrolase (beta-lactamase superfamily II)
MILKTLVVGPISANCFIIGDSTTNEGAIIDPGGNARWIVQVVKETGLAIQFIIATHGHFDHNAAVAPLKEALQCDFLLHKDDLPFVKRSKNTAMNWGISIDQVPDPDRYVNEGDILKVGGLELEIIHTPGHSPGGISLYIKSEGILFSGDTLFFSSIGRTDFDGGSMSQLQNSIREKLYTLPDNTVVYTGHGEQTTVGGEKTHNMFVRQN